MAFEVGLHTNSTELSSQSLCKSFNVFQLTFSYCVTIHRRKKKIAGVILPQYLANLTQPTRRFYHIFPVLRTLSSLGLKIYDVSLRFLERYQGFRALRTVGKCASRHIFIPTEDCLDLKGNPCLRYLPH